MELELELELEEDDVCITCGKHDMDVIVEIVA